MQLERPSREVKSQGLALLCWRRIWVCRFVVEVRVLEQLGRVVVVFLVWLEHRVLSEELVVRVVALKRRIERRVGRSWALGKMAVA
jgi:hypothetical protein